MIAEKDSGQEVAADDRGEFESALNAARKRERAWPSGSVVWAPQAGSQRDFIQCPVFEVLLHGPRGGGKSDALLMAFAQYVGRGYGKFWSGYIFRQTYPQLADLVARSERWFPRIFPRAKFNQQSLTWKWPDGEQLSFRYIKRPEDYWSYHGHERAMLGFDELTNWPDSRCYMRMQSVCRSSHPDVPRMVRAVTNSYGVGMQWVRERFGLAGGAWRGTVYFPETKEERARAAIYVHTDENRVLLEADPHYKLNVTAACDNDAMLAAWIEGSWDIVAGGMFSDVWKPEWNELPRGDIPGSWRVDRAFDWGSSKPFSVGWYAESDGTGSLPGGRPTVRGDVVRLREWYGWSGRPNEGLRLFDVDISKGIVEREMAWGLRGVHAGPADSSIMDVENGSSIAIRMAQPVIIGGRPYPGVQWTPADKRPGSRKAGWEQMREMIRSGHGRIRERPGLFIVREDNPQFLRTVLAAPRDEKDMDDVDTDAEEHVCDEVRYSLRARGASVSFSGRVVGGW